MDRARVAELIVTCAQERRRGSGYRVTRDAVLTAAHVLEDAVSVEVRFEPDLPGQWVSAAVSWWADARSDVALLLISPRTEGETLAAEEFGRLGDSPAVLDVQAVGFPRWKLRVDPDATSDTPARYRDACHAVGSVATLSNWREGTLEVALAFSPSPEPGGSPWEGMSGAALWAGNRLVGVVSKHHPGDGPSTLAAVRLDRALELADPPVKQALSNLAGLPEQAVQLPCVVPALTGQDAVAPVEVCPYPDMAAFRPEQAKWFFGREELTSKLVARLDHSLLHGGKPLIVVAPSGAGKSSLLQAGLVPKLEKAALPGSRSWPHVLLTPTHEPMTALTTKLAALLGDEPTTIAKQLTETPDQFVERLHTRLHARGDTAETTRPRLMLIVDQLEELFTLCTDSRERQRFLELISRLAETTPSGHDPVALIVYGLRADFYTRCADHRQLRAALQENQLVVGPMSEDELRDAIGKPAEHAGLDLEPTLVEVMLRDLGVGAEVDGGYEAGRLPLLAHALRATWRERDGNTLTLTGYHGTGGIRKAVETTADGVYAKLGEDEQRTARTLFLRLVHLGGEDADDTRRRVPRTELLRDTTDTDRVHTVLDAFTQARLLTQYQNTVEITHEVLLRAWPTLRRWIDTGRSAHLVRQDLDEAAQTWHRHGRSTGALFRGSRLREARESVKEQDLTPLGVEFLNASNQHERHVTQRRRMTFVGGWSLAALVGVLAIFLVIQLGITQQERDNAVVHQITAQADQQRTQNPSLAAQLDLTAHQKRRDHTNVSPNLLRTAHTPLSNPLLGIRNADSLALSANGHTLATASSANAALNSYEVRLWDVSNPNQPRPLGTPLPDSQYVSSMVLSADGHTLAINTTGRSDVDGEVRLWNVSNPNQPEPLGHPLPDSQYVSSMALSADGHTLATSTNTREDGDGEVRLWNVSNPNQPRPLGAPLPDSHDVSSMALNADGRTLATSSTVTGVQLRDVSNPNQPEPLGHPLPDSQYVSSMALSADGRTLATNSNPNVTSDAVRLWNIPTSSRISKDIDSSALSADGRTLATANITGIDGVWLWDASNGTDPRTLRRPVPNSQGTRSVAMSADGCTLATSTRDEDGVQLWDISDPNHPLPLGSPFLSSQNVTSVALSADGRTLATNTNSYSSDDGEVRLWDVSNPNHPLSTGVILPGSDDVSSLALSADAQTLATSTSISDGDDAVQLWDASNPAHLRPSGRRLSTSSFVTSVGLSADGDTLATSSGDDGVQLWDASNTAHPIPLGSPILGDQNVISMALSPDGQTLATNTSDGALRVWSQQQAIRRICETTMNNLDPHAWSEYLPDLPFDPPCKSPDGS